MVEPIRILVVDPEDDAADACVRGLERKGWLVDRARSYTDAAELGRKSVYDVTIIEVVLPDSRGTDLWKHLKSLHPEMAGILITRSPSFGDSTYASDSDILSLQVKPLQMDVISNSITQAVQTQRAIASKIQREREMSGIAIWLSNLTRASTRRQVLQSAMTHLEVIVPSSWTVAFFSSKGHLAWMSRSVEGPSIGPWTQRQCAYLEGLAKEAMRSRRVITSSTAARVPNPKSLDVLPGAWIIGPVIGRRETHGAMAIIDERNSERTLSETEIDLVTAINKILALALDRQVLAKALRSLVAPVKATRGHG